MLEVQKEFIPSRKLKLTLSSFRGFSVGPLEVDLWCDSEKIVELKTRLGFAHKNLEARFSQVLWAQTIPLASRIDPEASIFGEVALCLALEEIGEIDPPPRAKAIRLIAMELERLASHYLFLFRSAKLMGVHTVAQYVLRERERVLDLLELLSGSRRLHHLARVGGVVHDVSEGFVVRLQELCAYLESRFDEPEQLLLHQRWIVDRTAVCGEVLLNDAERFGLSGPSARASGLIDDLRDTDPTYQEILMEAGLASLAPTARNGSAYARIYERFYEIKKSIKILSQAAVRVPAGEFLAFSIGAELEIPDGMAFASVESPRGRLSCFAVSQGGRQPKRVSFSTPSSFSLLALEQCAIGERLSDFEILANSFDLSIAEIDR